MKKFFKYLAITLVALVLVLGALIIASIVYKHFKELSWTPPTEKNGVALGMNRSDLFFNVPMEYKCFGETDPEQPRWAGWIDEDADIGTCSELSMSPIAGAGAYSYTVKVDSVTFENDKMVRWVTYEPGREIPFADVEGMKRILGQPDIEWISGNYKDRKYTYLEHQAVFYFRTNELQGYAVGKIRWRHTSSVSPVEAAPWQSENDFSEFKIRGEVVCLASDSSASECPFNADGTVKDGYPYRYPSDLP